MVDMREDGPSVGRQSLKPLRLTFLHNAAAPYQVEFFNSLAARDEVEKLQVYYCQLRLRNRPWRTALEHRYAHEVLKGLHFSVRRPTSVYHFNPGIIRRLLKAGRQDVWVICGYSDPTNQIAMAWRTLFRQPWLMLTEEPEKSSQEGAVAEPYSRGPFFFSSGEEASASLPLAHEAPRSISQSR